MQANALSHLVWRGRCLASRATLRWRGDSAPLRCFIDPAAWRSSVLGVYRELLAQGLGQPAPLDRAELVLVQKERYAHYAEVRAATGGAFALSQLPHVTPLLDEKRRFYALCEGKPYGLEWYEQRCDHPLSGLWIEKPVDGDKGRDLRVLRDPECWNRPGYILQKYVEDPSLLEGRKYEIRALVRVADDGTFLVHGDALVRCAHRPYSPDDLDPLIHNSNASFQSRHGIWRHVHCRLSDLPHFERSMAQIGRAIEDTVAAVRTSGHFGGSDDFELLGYDFVMDSAGRIYALEANQYPGMHFATRAYRRFFREAARSLFTRDRGAEGVSVEPNGVVS